MKITRRDLLATPMAASALAAQEAAGPLNIIHIGVDTWSTHYLGCYGNTWVRTPALDGLACESFVFDQALIDSPDVSRLHPPIVMRGAVAVRCVRVVELRMDRHTGDDKARRKEQ